MQEKFLKALEKCGNNKARAAKRIGVTYRTIANWQNEDAEFAEQVRDVHESMLDDVVESLYQQARGKKEVDEETGDVTYSGGNAIAAMFVLKTQAAHRGFVEKKQLEVAGTGGKPLVIMPAFEDVEDAEIVEPEQISENTETSEGD